MDFKKLHYWRVLKPTDRFKPRLNSNSFCPSGMENTRITVPCKQQLHMLGILLNILIQAFTMVSVMEKTC